MEFNASVSLEEARYYTDLYQSEDLVKIDPRYELLSHFIAADVLYYNEKVDSSLYHYLSLASKGKFEKQFMLAVSGLGNAAYVLSDLGDKRGAVDLLKQNVEVSKNTGDIRDYADYTFNIAKYYDDLRIRDSAIHYFEKTVDIDRLRNNESGMLYNMHTLLEKYIEGENYKQALELCQECIEIADRIQDPRAKGQCKSSQAFAYLKIGSLSKAENSINEAISIDEIRQDATRMSRHFRVLASILLAKKQFKRSNENYEKANRLAQVHTSKEDLILAHLAYSNALLEQNKYKKALLFAEKAGQFIEEDQLNQYELKSLQLLSEINLRKGDLAEALKYEQMETQLLSSMLSSENLVLTNQSKNAFDLFKLENINRALTTEKELAEAKIRRRNMIMIASALVLLLLLSLAYFAYQNQVQKSRLQAQRLEFQVVEKELLALRSQMNPHFLFNSLNSINDYIMHEEPRIASKYLTKFSNLMRTILNNSKKQLISLSEELEALSLYVEMENLRFTNQFDYSVSVDPEISEEELMLPSMILQPYMENAIKHGLRNNLKDGILKLNIMQDGSKTQFEIYDNGVGRAEAMRYKSTKDVGRKSHGMSITSDRIKALNKIYKMNASLRIVDHLDPSGTSIFIELEAQK